MPRAAESAAGIAAATPNSATKLLLFRLLNHLVGEREQPWGELRRRNTTGMVVLAAFNAVSAMRNFSEVLRQQFTGVYSYSQWRSRKRPKEKTPAEVNQPDA